MRFVEHDQTPGHFAAAAQRIEQLIAINLRRANNQQRIRILFAIAGQNADSLRAKLLDELLVF